MFRRAAAAAALTIFAPSTAFATWSVIAVDMSTGRVVIASATCVDRDDMFLRGVQAVVVPGKGVAACQAGVDGTHANQNLVFAELQKGTDPARIIELLSAEYGDWNLAKAWLSRELKHAESVRPRGASHES